MKKVFSILTMCLLVLSSFANNLNNDSINSNILNSVNESQNHMIVKITINEKVKEYKYSYNSTEELYNADSESILISIEKDLSNVLGGGCMIHVSFTVSVGFGATSASMTVSGDFPCETWKEDVKKLKADAQELLLGN